MAIQVREHIFHRASEQATGALLAHWELRIWLLAYRAEGVPSGHDSGKEEQSSRSIRKMDIIDN